MTTKAEALDAVNALLSEAMALTGDPNVVDRCAVLEKRTRDFINYAHECPPQSTYNRREVMSAKLAWESEGLTEGWRLTLPSGEKQRIRCSICESSGGGLRQAMKEARDLSGRDDIYAIAPEHNRFDGSQCLSNTCRRGLK